MVCFAFFHEITPRYFLPFLYDKSCWMNWTFTLSPKSLTSEYLFMRQTVPTLDEPPIRFTLFMVHVCLQVSILPFITWPFDVSQALRTSYHLPVSRHLFLLTWFSRRHLTINPPPYYLVLPKNLHGFYFLSYIKNPNPPRTPWMTTLNPVTTPNL